jgi:DnaJ like chaperone protein
LGIDETIRDEDIKKAYRRMASANHPDRIMARGLPPEMQGLASKKMAMINLAYEKILAERGLAA